MSFKHTALNNMTLGGKNKILQEEPLSVGEINFESEKQWEESF